MEAIRLCTKTVYNYGLSDDKKVEDCTMFGEKKKRGKSYFSVFIGRYLFKCSILSGEYCKIRKIRTTKKPGKTRKRFSRLPDPAPSAVPPSTSSKLPLLGVFLSVSILFCQSFLQLFNKNVLFYVLEEVPDQMLQQVTVASDSHLVPLTLSRRARVTFFDILLLVEG